MKRKKKETELIHSGEEIREKNKTILKMKVTLEATKNNKHK